MSKTTPFRRKEKKTLVDTSQSLQALIKKITAHTSGHSSGK